MPRTILPGRTSAVASTPCSRRRSAIFSALRRASSAVSERGVGESISTSTSSRLTTRALAPGCPASCAAVSATQGSSAPALAATTMVCILPHPLLGCGATYPSDGTSIVPGSMPPFKLDAVYSPTADQPAAIASLAEGIEAGGGAETPVGARRRGKTMTMAATIEAVQRPALIIAHNKTLAAQLCNEFRTYFPSNSVEYFVSYYDYYQPEAYVPSRDLYIEKDSAINQEIDRLRHAATASLFARRDVIIVASV